MTGNPCVWFEIYVQDMNRAKRFYEAVFKVSMQKLNSPSQEMEYWTFPSEQTSYGSGGALVKMDGMSAGGASTTVYFQCNDCAVEEARAKEAGGRIHRSKMSIGEYGHISLVYDTEGNMIGLHSMT
ncbi:MAG: VOC family protein [Xanthobacteraceae bacterium]|nr:MAG: VOC family protein [Xanthobacteraceae bacterium]